VTGSASTRVERRTSSTRVERRRWRFLVEEEFLDARRARRPKLSKLTSPRRASREASTTHDIRAAANVRDGREAAGHPRDVVQGVH